MADQKTIDGLNDTLDDILKVLDKAEEKYGVVNRRFNTVRKAFTRLSTEGEADQDTLDGLNDTMEDLHQQLDKAQEKYETLKWRSEAVQSAVSELNEMRLGS